MLIYIAPALSWKFGGHTFSGWTPGSRLALSWCLHRAESLERNGSDAGHIGKAGRCPFPRQRQVVSQVTNWPRRDDPRLVRVSEEGLSRRKYEDEFQRHTFRRCLKEDYDSWMRSRLKWSLTWALQLYRNQIRQDLIRVYNHHHPGSPLTPRCVKYVQSIQNFSSGCKCTCPIFELYWKHLFHLKQPWPNCSIIAIFAIIALYCI